MISGVFRAANLRTAAPARRREFGLDEGAAFGADVGQPARGIPRDRLVRVIHRSSVVPADPKI